MSLSPLLRLVVSSLLVLALSCVGAPAGPSEPSGPTGPSITSLSQLDAIWNLSGTFSLICDGVAEHEDLSGASIAVFNGSFNERVYLPAATCSVGSIQFQGAIGLDGSLTGNISTVGGNPVLTDVLTGTCSATSCTGQSANTGLLAFTLSNTMEIPFATTPWNLAIHCSDGTLISASSVTLDPSGAITAAGSAFCRADAKACTATGSETVAESFAFNGNVTAQGALTGTLMQGGTAGEISFTATPNAALSIFNGTGSSGTSMTLTVCPAEGCPVCNITD